MIVGERDGTFNTVSISRAVEEMVGRDRRWVIPYKRDATNRIVKILKKKESEILEKKIWW